MPLLLPLLLPPLLPPLRPLLPPHPHAHTPTTDHDWKTLNGTIDSMTLGLQACATHTTASPQILTPHYPLT